MVESAQLKYFKVPFLAQQDTDKENLHIIGIIDASGSMSSWWKWLAEFWNTVIPKNNLYTITFDSKPRVCESNVLSNRIQDHGGGMTAIPDVFKVFETHLATVSTKMSVTALFISDGQDNNLSTLDKRMEQLKGNSMNHKINFICLGIQQQFPTFLSMRLRNLYHRGDENIPALYLIEYVSEKAFFNKFEGIKKYFYSSGQVKLDPSVNLYPWDETVVDSAYEGGWIILKGDEVIINAQTKVKFSEDYKVEDLVEIIRGWIQQLQLVSLNDIKTAQEYAKIAQYEGNKLIDKLNEQMKVDIRSQETQTRDAFDTFYEKSKKNYVFRYGQRINWFMQEIDQLAAGKSPKFESEFEAAKRMNLGTITGKYEQKVLALKTLTIGEFSNVINEFIITLKKTKFDKNSDNFFKKLVNQPQFLDGFKFIRSQFDLIETFAYCGLAAKVKRSEGYEGNPWKLDMWILNYQGELNTLAFKQFRVDLNEGKKEKQQPNVLISNVGEDMSEYNAIIPFFTENDGDLNELLNTRLFRFLVSFSVTSHPDGIFEWSYASLISQVVQHLYMNGSKFNEKQKYLDLCVSSLNIFYSKNKEMKNQLQDAQDDPSQFLKKYKELPIDQLFLLLFLLAKNKLMDNKELSVIRDQILLFQMQKLVKKEGILNLLKPEFKDEEKDKIQKHIEDHLAKYFALSDFRKDFAKRFEEYLQTAEKSITISKKYFQHDNIFSSIEQFSIDELQQPINLIEYSFMAKHVNENEFDYFDKPMDRNIDLLKQSVLDKVDEEQIKKMPGYTEMYSLMELAYTNKFKKNHFGIKPMTLAQIQMYCKEKEYDATQLKYNSDTGLCSNACMSQNCPFFLQSKPELRKHLGGWQDQLPTGFHRFVSKRIDKKPDEIYTAALQRYKVKVSQKGKKKNQQDKPSKSFPQSYGLTKEQTLQYIEEIVSNLLLLKVNDAKSQKQGAKVDGKMNE